MATKKKATKKASPRSRRASSGSASNAAAKRNRAAGAKAATAAAEQRKRSSAKRRKAPKQKTGRPISNPAKAAKISSKSKKRTLSETLTDEPILDAMGALMCFLAVLAALGVWLGSGGPVGAGMKASTAWLMGALHYLSPFVFAAAGVSLIRMQRPLPRTPPRRVVGATTVVIGLFVLLHLLGGQPSASMGTDELGKAGGILGVLIGGGFVAAVGTFGAAVMVPLLVALGVIVALAIPLNEVVDRSSESARYLSGWALGSVDALAADEEELVDDEWYDEDDQADDGEDGWAGGDSSLDRGSDGDLTNGSTRPPLIDLDRSDHTPAASRRGRSGLGPGPEADIDLTGPHRADELEPAGVWSDVAELRKEQPARAELFDQDAAARSAQPDADQWAAQMAAEPEPEVIEPGPGAKPRRPRKYRPPKLALLERSRSGVVDESSAAAAGEGVVRALEEHGVETRLTGMVVGPTVTRYELELGPGVKVSKVKNLADDIAYAMAASGGVRILAPVPGKRAVGVEVPNEDRRLVTLGDILNSREAKAARHPLEVAVGKDINGNAVMANLAEMPHVLVAGATGAGKSSCINCLLTSILLRSRPDEVRMILIDPKRVELGQYNGLPHLLTQVVDKPKKAANALAWAVREMERRYDLLSDARFRDITGYNEAYDSGELRQAAVEAGFIDGMVDVDTGKEKYPRLPFILIVVDELNDLMMVAARDVEDSIMRIAQMARAVGIHLIIATQRPSRDVITGVIKANIPARWALAVSSAVDSRVIMDQIGAERLVGRGDMLLLDGKSSVPTRVQGAWVTESEVRSIVDAWRAQVSTDGPGYDEEIQGSEEGSSQGSGGSVRSGGDDEDDLLDEARELVVRSGLGSTSMLQRKLRVGFARAGRLMDLLENEGVVGPSEGSKAREVQMTVEELEAGVEPGSGVGAPSGGSPSAPSQGPNSPDTPTLDEGPHLGIAQPPQSIGSEPGPASSGHPSAHRAPPSELR